MVRGRVLAGWRLRAAALALDVANWTTVEHGRYASWNMLRSLRHGLALLLAGSTLAVSTQACSLALGLGEDQCTTTADCTKRGFAGSHCEQHVCVSDATTGSSSSSSSSGSGGAGGSDPAWSCLPGFMTPVAPAKYPVEFQIVMAVGGALPGDLVVKQCSSFDAGCTAPIDSNVTLDADGKHTFMVDPSFGNGFLEITSPSDATYPTLAFFGAPTKIPPSIEIIRLTTPAQLNGLLTLTGLSQDPNHGISIALTSNCLDARTDGVTLKATAGSDASTIGFYFNGQNPNVMATQTDAEGAGGFINLKPGVVTIESSRFSTGEFIGKISFQVRTKTISYVPIAPTTPL